MLGIDIGNYSVKVAVVKKTGKNAVIEQAVYEVLPEEFRGGLVDTSTLKQLVTRLIKTTGKGHNSVSLSVPTSSAILKTLELDASLTDSLLEGEVQLELVNFVPFPLDQVYLDYVSLGKSKQNSDKQEVFVVISRRDIVDKISSAIDVKSIRKKEVDIKVFAIAQLLEQVKGKNYRETYAVIDVGYQASEVSVFGSGGDIIFNREQQIGGLHLTEAIAEANGISLSEAEKIKLESFHNISSSVISGYLDSFTEQIGLALEFFSSTNNQSIDTIYLTGGGSVVTGIIEHLSEHLSDYVFKFLPIGQEIKIGRKVSGMTSDEVQSLTAVAVGLAMRE
ncbi:MAG: type IV pilus assembly protein PilM [Ostreibacterium sp.]